MLEITVKGEPQEIAALAAALQERRMMEVARVKVDFKEIFKDVFESTHDTPQEHGT